MKLEIDILRKRGDHKSYIGREIIIDEIYRSLENKRIKHEKLFNGEKE